SRTWKFAEIVARATPVFGSQAAAEKWLNEPARALGGKKPIELLATQPGTQLVEDLLQQIDYGVYVGRRCRRRWVARTSSLGLSVGTSMRRLGMAARGRFWPVDVGTARASAPSTARSILRPPSSKSRCTRGLMCSTPFLMC